MKKLLSLLFVVLAVQVSGQESYKQLLVDGKTWNYSEGNFFAGYRDMRQTVDGDTLFGSKVWKKVYIEVPTGSPRLFDKAMREEDGKVYELQKIYSAEGGFKEVLFADFSATVGNKYMEEEGQYVEVTSSEQVEVEGLVRHQITLQQYQEDIDYDAYGNRMSHWTESIGGDCGIYQSVQWMGFVGNNCTLLTCYEGDVCIYKHSQADGIGTVVRPISPQLFDLQGRQLQDKPDRGMYIQDGRKVVIK